MKLITEEVAKVKFITEGKGAKKKMYIEGVFLQGEIKNRNGRMYPVNTLSREVNRYNESFIKKGRALGELGHPDGPTVNLDRVSHKITQLRQEGNNFIGKAQLLDTPMGKIAKSLIDEGYSDIFLYILNFFGAGVIFILSKKSILIFSRSTST